MASRSLDDLAAPVRQAALDFLADCHAAGLEVLIYCTLRLAVEQASLYAVGRTAPGHVLTNAKPGQSLHNPDELGKSWAFDAVPMLHGKCMFHDAAMIDKMGAIGETVGLQWAGRWRGALRERLHFQIQRTKK